MGGEQIAVLLYGPYVQKTIQDWVVALGLVNKKEWVTQFLADQGEEPVTAKSMIESIFDEECGTSFLSDVLRTFLLKHGLLIAFDNNVSWNEGFIGFKVKNYNSFHETDKQCVAEFCRTYKLPAPTFYAGICGEFE